MDNDLERDAYNATFYELGLRWHWDDATYARLVQHSEQPEARLRHYLETCQPHMLKAYDADFLVDVIQQRAAQHKPCTAHRFDGSQALSPELGA